MPMKREIRVMVNGLNPDPKFGKMARMIAERVLSSEDFSLVPYSLTGPEVTEPCITFSDTGPIQLIRPDARETLIDAVRESHGDFISVDFSVPDAVNLNADFYCRHNLPFIMGTTGGKRESSASKSEPASFDTLEHQVQDSNICAVIAPNMAVPIVALMDFMDRYSQKYELRGCVLEIKESHQYGKKDTSGTAREMVRYFQKMGIKFDVKDIKMVRDPQEQLKMGVPEEHLGGHGWHTYSLKACSRTGEDDISDLYAMLASGFFNKDNPALKGYALHDGHPNCVKSATSPDENVFLDLKRGLNSPLSLIHNINGRGVYVDGTLDYAVPYVWEAVQSGEKGKVYSMIDVLKK